MEGSKKSVKKYYAWSYEHMGAFWKAGLHGYTYFPDKAHIFTKEEILEKQKNDLYAGWNFVTEDNLDQLPEFDEWAIEVNKVDLIISYSQDNIRGYTTLKTIEKHHGIV